MTSIMSCHSTHTLTKIKKLETIIGWFLSDRNVRIEASETTYELQILYDSFMSDYVSRISSKKSKKRSRFGMETNVINLKPKKKEWERKRKRWRETRRVSQCYMLWCNSHIPWASEIKSYSLRTKRRVVQTHAHTNTSIKSNEANNKSPQFVL